MIAGAVLLRGRDTVDTGFFLEVVCPLLSTANFATVCKVCIVFSAVQQAFDVDRNPA